MISFFTGVFKFHFKIDQLVINQIIESSDKIFQKANLLLCHSLNAHQIWNAKIANRNPLGVFDIHPPKDCIELDKSNFETTKLIIQNEDLEKIILCQNSKGIKLENTIQDILFHISNHYSHRRGQLVSELKQTGIEPLISDYIYHKRAKI